MKNKSLGVGVLLLGTAAVGYVVLLWVEHPNKLRVLELKQEELKQYEFELHTLKVGALELPFLLEKKSGATYRYVFGPSNSTPLWEQLQYNQFVTRNTIPVTLPVPMPHGFSPGAKVPPLTAEERKKLEDAVSSRKGIRLDSLLDQPASSESTKQDK